MTLLTVREAAQKFRKSERFVLDEIRNKNLRAAKFGGQWHVKLEDADSYIDAHMNVREVRGAAS